MFIKNLIQGSRSYPIIQGNGPYPTPTDVIEKSLIMSLSMNFELILQNLDTSTCHCLRLCVVNEQQKCCGTGREPV